MASSFITQRLSHVAAELEERHEAELAELRQRLSQAEVDRMHSQLACLRFEAALHESTANGAELETRMRAAEDENHRLRQDDPSADSPRLVRINNLSRELIATRFELAAVAATASRGGGNIVLSPATDAATRRRSAAGWRGDDAAIAGAARLGAEALVEAAQCLDLAAADSILNPACVRCEPTPGDGVADSAGAPGGTPADGDGDAPPRAPLAAALDAALLAVCRPKGRRALSFGGAATPERKGSPVAGDGTPAAAGGAMSDAGADAPRDSDAACAILEALLLRGASPDAAGADGVPALHAACEAGMQAQAVLLIQHAADLDAYDGAGRTPLHCAAAAGAAPLVELLLRYGADDSLPDREGRSAARLAATAAGDGALAVLSDPSLRIAGMAKRANALYRSQAYGAATTAYLAALALATSAADGASGGASTDARAASAADVATLHFNCARAALKDGRFVLALEQSTGALDTRAEYTNARMVQAECRMELLEFDEAAASYHALQELEPDNGAWADCAAKAGAMAAASAYELLGVPPTCAAADVKRAYHAQCLQWHPDKHSGSAEDQRRATTVFKRVTSAYGVLADEVQRADLDLELQLAAIRARAAGERSAAAAHAHGDAEGESRYRGEASGNRGGGEGFAAVAGGGGGGGGGGFFGGGFFEGYGYGGEDLRPRWPSTSPSFESDAE